MIDTVSVTIEYTDCTRAISVWCHLFCYFLQHAAYQLDVVVYNLPKKLLRRKLDILEAEKYWTKTNYHME